MEAGEGGALGCGSGWVGVRGSVWEGEGPPREKEDVLWGFFPPESWLLQSLDLSPGRELQGADGRRPRNGKTGIW